MLVKNIFYFFLVFQSLTFTIQLENVQSASSTAGCVRFLRSALDLAKDNLTKDYSNQTIVLANGEEVQLSRRLGSGISSSVYQVISRDGVVPAHEQIIKIIHRWRSTGRVIPFSEKQLAIEAESYHLKELYHVPVVPIESKVKFNGAPALIKPFLRGTPLKNLIIKAKYAKGLTEIQKKKLHDLYLIQKKIYAEQKVWIDLNTTNMTWLSNPSELKTLGLSEPSMVLYELSAGPNMSHIYPKNHTFEDFLEFLDNIK